VRDGVFAARKGLPSIALVTEEFVDQGTLIARALGMPDLPRTVIEHPISGTGLANLERVAKELAPRLLEALQPKKQ
jgi:hypothetical protein